MHGSGEDSGVDSRVGVANVDFSVVFNDFEGVGVENVDFPLVFQGFLGGRS